jgi:PAS domain S-box-containing protein
MRAKNGRVERKNKKRVNKGEQKLSDEKFRFLFETMAQGVVYLDALGKITSVNPAAERLLGLTLDQMQGMTSIHPGWRAIHEDGTDFSGEEYPSIVALKTGKEVRDVVMGFFNPESEEICWNNVHAAPQFRQGDDKPYQVYTTFENITGRMMAEEKLKLFSEAVEEAPDGVQIVDLNGYVTYSNRAVEEMYGIPREELKGKHVNEMNVDPEFASRVILPSIKETGRWVGELMVRHKDGHEFPIWLTTSMVKDRKGNPIDMVGIIREMTERKLFEKALKESEESYRSLFENSPISLWEEDSSRVKKYIDGLRSKGVKDFRKYFESHPEEVESCAKMVRVINVNNATLSLFRARSKEELLKGLTKIFTKHSYDIFREELLAIAEGRTVFEGEDFISTLTGDILQIYMKWSVAPGYEETYSRRHVSIIDITERKRIEEAIKKYAQKLEESNRMKELFSDIMHHDLMNTLTTASGFAELLKEEDAGNRMYIETIEKNLIKSMDLIECATKFSRIDSLDRIDFTDMDLKEVIDEVIENLRPMAGSAGMKIESIIAGSMPVKANKIIEEVFSNLISNAIKYARDGKRIIVKCEDRNPFWNVMIIDFGKGLKMTDKTIVFDRFCRLEKKGIKGSGLGLAIAKKIVELHRGGIGVEDNPQGGAIFIVEIPKSEYLDQIH